MIPNYFSKAKIGEIKNPNLIKAIVQVKNSSNQKEAIEKAYQIIGKRFHGYRFKTYFYFWKAFKKDPNILWNQTGFMHCHHQNFLLRVLLVKSGWFKDSDISLGHTLVAYVSPHQYLKLNLADKKLALDPWNSGFGCKVGEYATGFGRKKL